MTNEIGAWVFDAYGTLFDPLSVRAAAEAMFPGKGEALSRLWRARQLEYTWLRALMNRYADFWQVTRDALTFACRSLEIECEWIQQEELMQEYLRLEIYPDVRDGLNHLQGHPLVILSNGTPEMLEYVVAHNRLDRTFAAVLSVDKVKTYKPSPCVYQMAVEQLHLPPNQIGFVSSNYWDAVGATAFGYQTVWLNRSGAKPEELGVSPGSTVMALNQI